MKPTPSRPSPSPSDALREERRALLHAGQNELLRLLGKDVAAVTALERKVVRDLRALAGRVDRARHEAAPDWEAGHGRMLRRVLEHVGKERVRHVQLKDGRWPPFPEPEDYFGEPDEDLGELGPGGDGQCSVSTYRVIETANHGPTVTTSPATAPQAVTQIAFDPTPGLNEVKLAAGITSDSKTADVLLEADASWRFNFHPPADSFYTVRPLAFLNGSWLLWPAGPGLEPSRGDLRVTVGLRVSQFDGPTLYEVASREVVVEAAVDESREGAILYSSVADGEPLELGVPLARELRTHVIVRCTVTLHLTGSGVIGVNLNDPKYYFRVPEVQIDHFNCHGLLPSERSRLSVRPSLAALRVDDEFALVVQADPPFDGSVLALRSTGAVSLEDSSVTMTDGVGVARITGREA
ncbi:MAG TPA: hypothetical protein VFX28_03515, partial [Methylomirabilota bacterium]|nr:hypothetical protein [Methylomirabilota bacterium]